MNDEIEVGPRIEVPFPVMTVAGFPWGLRCDTCKRPITEGQPYREDLDGVYDNGDTTAVLRCVYCPADDGVCGEEYAGSAITCAMPRAHDGDHCNVAERTRSGAIIPGSIAWPNTPGATTDGETA